MTLTNDKFEKKLFPKPFWVSQSKKACAAGVKSITLKERGCKFHSDIRMFWMSTVFCVKGRFHINSVKAIHAVVFLRSSQLHRTSPLQTHVNHSDDVPFHFSSIMQLESKDDSLITSLTLPPASDYPARPPSKLITTSELMTARTGGFFMFLDTGDKFHTILISTTD
ncbi:hypothetical protein AVEN_95402-1 [Araneus ventricosus]|uniref:Uncharacterized protein n=1 Tax=Araneus ventricosus TaxID=182803 RepID=A0A4Y2CH50_ARAVE|nr:hypothetical protein AVEN_95402-1 [Araneus ventricosus]